MYAVGSKWVVLDAGPSYARDNSEGLLGTVTRVTGTGAEACVYLHFTDGGHDQWYHPHQLRSGCKRRLTRRA